MKTCPCIEAGLLEDGPGICARAGEVPDGGLNAIVYGDEEYTGDDSAAKAGGTVSVCHERITIRRNSPNTTPATMADMTSVRAPSWRFCASARHLPGPSRPIRAGL